MNDRQGADATWVYAISRAAGTGSRPVGGDLSGVAGEAVRRVESGELAAVVGSVPLTDFSEEALREHLEDLAWLEDAARAHHRIIDAAVAALAAVVPLRFATVYHDDDRVRSLLEQRREDLLAALERVEGRTEWGVKGYVDPRRFAAGDAASGGGQSDARSASRESSGGGARPGTDYLLRRKAERESQDTAHERAIQRAADIDAALVSLATDRAEHRPQDARLAQYEGWMVLNNSYLVADARAEEFAALVADLRTRFPDVRLELSGPWPPYSFTASDPAADPGVEEGQAHPATSTGPRAEYGRASGTTPDEV
ncbi:GvpL/GvpF family gas vesicle protein [Streptomyces sp. NPDC047108]|uniref:GvpL/GvpF family gas vesicle protein n=1 Tax=Streptomyces sp. NPDC047108 TaxID=3155025 RepID=UPI0033C50C82